MATGRRRRLDLRVQRRIAELISTATPSQIYDVLEREFAHEPTVVPNKRTVQRVVADLRPRDTSGEWRLSDADPEDAALVLPAVAELLIRTKGQVPVTNAEAEQLVRLRRAADDLTPWSAWELARLYTSLSDSARDLIPAIDAVVAFAPWRDDAHRERYEEARAAGWLPANSRELGVMAWVMGFTVVPPIPPTQYVRVDGETGIVTRSQPAAEARAQKGARGGKTRKR